MKPIDHSTCNLVFNAPEGLEDAVASIQVRSGTEAGQPTLTTLWRPSPKELAKLLMGHPIAVVVLGTGLPPMKLEVEDRRD